MIWHVLDVRAVWIKEFAAALAAQTPTLGWCPRITGTAIFRDREEQVDLIDPLLGVRYFPLQRGFAKFPVRPIARESSRLMRRLIRQTPEAEDSVLVCTSPHYAPIAERWPGQVVYYVTDFFPAYGGNPKFIRALDRRLCLAANLICPNSQRIADYLVREAGCAPAKIAIVPNATRAENILSAPALQVSSRLPDDLSDLPRPLAGVIGNLAGNTDWQLMEEVIGATPWLSWVFVGPTDMAIAEAVQSQARQRVMNLGSRIRFVGSKPYAELKQYARAIDVAVLPYRDCEPTYSGSSTRFYEHLAAGRPMLATRAPAELLSKEPLVRLVASAGEMIFALDQLRMLAFSDGYEELRWQTSLTETWDERATRMRRGVVGQAKSAAA